MTSAKSLSAFSESDDHHMAGYNVGSAWLNVRCIEVDDQIVAVWFANEKSKATRDAATR